MPFEVQRQNSRMCVLDSILLKVVAAQRQNSRMCVLESLLVKLVQDPVPTDTREPFAVQHNSELKLFGKDAVQNYPCQNCYRILIELAQESQRQPVSV